MKELSIKEKAKRYDEALKVLHKYDGANIMFSQSLKEEMFPELKESEDEKVRKELINYLDNFTNSEDRELVDKFIAWLEKQGESDETKAKMFLINKGYPIDANGIFPMYEEMYNIIREGFEKQGEQKPQEKSALEAAKEEKVDNRNCVKPTNNVEPKFKVGDWVVWDNKIYCHVDNIYQGKESLMYTITDAHNMTRSYSVKGFDNNAHLWTIQDAKDGDVLSYKDEIFIVKNSSNLNIVYYCCYDNYHFITESIYSLTIDDLIDVKPATKEQRNLLFQKMKEAGYKWNAEKKELNKIEQKPAEWSEEDEEMYKEVLTDIIYAKNDLKVKECLGLSKRAMKAFNWFSKRYKSLKPQNWTKEDKKRYISCLQRLSTGNPKQPETINSKWFKEHVYPQTNWKPSEEQMDALESAIVDSISSIQKHSLESLYNELKKLF